VRVRRGRWLARTDLPLWLSWCEVKRGEGKKRLYVAATFAATSAYLAQRYCRRWLIEPFFISIKYDFGLKEAHLRSKTGIPLWIFLACLACSFASLERSLSQQTITLLEVAQRTLNTLVDVCLIHSRPPSKTIPAAPNPPPQVFGRELPEVTPAVPSVAPTELVSRPRPYSESTVFTWSRAARSPSANSLASPSCQKCMKNKRGFSVIM